MKSYKKMYMSSYSQENFYVDKFEMGADAYREGYDGINERLRIVSILSANSLYFFSIKSGLQISLLR